MIKAERKFKGKDIWFTAYCPLCGNSQDTTVIDSNFVAEKSVIGKIVAHLKLSHKDEVENDV